MDWVDPPEVPYGAGRPTLEAELDHEIERMHRAGLARMLRPIERRDGATVELDGRRMVDFASNDYLGLASDPRVAAAARAALEGEGLGAAAARLITGNHPYHTALEREIASFKGAESALLFPSGYAANTGTVPALVGKGDAVYMDELNHASLIDGARLSRAEIRVFPHMDLSALDRMLASDVGRHRHALVVVDGMFSMHGDTFPLRALVPMARRYGAWTYVDDAHATGVLGATGRGTTEQYRPGIDVDVVMGTLGKALGTVGAFVVGSSTLVEYLRHRARTFVFTTGSPPALAAAASEALRIAQDEPWRRERVRENAARLRRGLERLGFTPAGAPDGHIIPVPMRGVERTVEAADRLRQRGFLVAAVRPPSVPRGGSRLRVTVSAAHTGAQVDSLVRAIAPLLRPAWKV